MITQHYLTGLCCATLILFVNSWQAPLSAEGAVSVNDVIAAAPIEAEQETPEPPADLYTASIEGNHVILRWTAPASGATPTEYVLEGGLNSGEALASLSTGSTTPAVMLMVPDGAFYVRAYTLSGNTRSRASNEIRIYINQPVEPSAPSNLLATVNGSSVSLAWRNTFAGGTPESLILDVTGSATGSLLIGRTESAKFDGVPGGKYTVSVRAANMFGASGGSNTLTLTVPDACSGVPEAPSEFLAVNGGNAVYAVWESSNSGPAPDTYTVIVNGTHSGTIDTTNRVLSGTLPAGTYNVTVRGNNACGAGVPTATQVVVVP